MAWLPVFPPEEQRPYMFSGAPISGVLALRQQQQQYVQKQLMDAMNQYRQDQAANTLLSSNLQQYGLPDSGDLAGQGSYGLRDYGALAQMAREQDAEKERSLTESAQRNLYGIHGDLYNARINALNNPPPTGMNPDTGLPYGTFRGSDGQLWRQGRYGPIPVNQPGTKAQAPLSSKQLDDQFGIGSNQQLLMGGQGVIEDKTSGSGYRYTKPGETPTATSFSPYDASKGPKNVYTDDELNAIRKRQGLNAIQRPSGAGTPPPKTGEGSLSDVTSPTMPPGASAIMTITSTP